jgi:hypothetical protein
MEQPRVALTAVLVKFFLNSTCERSNTMKRTPIAIALLAAALAVQPLTAAAQSTTGKPAAKPGAGMQMDSKLQQQMMNRMKEMQAHMEKIRQTTDPNERQKLMAEHMKSMQEGMQMMRGAGGGMMGMMGGAAGGGMMGPRGGGGQSPQMMERRMDMMQMMMEQMMQHQQMMQSTPTK